MFSNETIERKLILQGNYSVQNHWEILTGKSLLSSDPRISTEGTKYFLEKECLIFSHELLH